MSKDGAMPNKDSEDNNRDVGSKEKLNKLRRFLISGDGVGVQVRARQVATKFMVITGIMMRWTKDGSRFVQMVKDIDQILRVMDDDVEHWPSKEITNFVTNHFW